MKPDKKQDIHVPVLLNETLAALQISAGEWYVDATAGGGGHTAAILACGGRVLALDQDIAAVQMVRGRLRVEIDEGRLVIREANFADLKKVVKDAGIDHIKGVLFDLGMSTQQIKQSGRGFSFRNNEKLDMRMSATINLAAADIVNTYSQDNLYEIFHKFGEEHLARKLAVAIHRTRALKPIETTGELQRIAAEVYGKAGIREKIDPATRIFQALRIVVNRELENLRLALPQALEVLDRQGNCAVISFHSLEDRVVKRFFLEKAKAGKVEIMTKKPLTPVITERRSNPASRSGKLRVVKKL